MHSAIRVEFPSGTAGHIRYENAYLYRPFIKMRGKHIYLYAGVDDDTTMGVVSPEEPALTSVCPEKNPRYRYGLTGSALEVVPAITPVDQYAYAFLSFSIPSIAGRASYVPLSISN
jgi:hypothetical protein